MNEILGYLSKVEAESFTREPWIKEKLEVLRAHNQETYEHSLRVAFLASLIASREYLPSYERSTLITSALLHDIGKTEIPNKLLNAGALTDEEKKEIDKHVRASFEIVKRHDPLVAKVIIGHHEFQDRRYPRSTTRVTEEMIVKELQFFLALCDNVDSLLSKRSYKEAWTKEKAFDVLKRTFKDEALLVFTIDARLAMEK